MGRIEVWVRPGARAEELRWDPWREAWIVSVREPPVGGAANHAVLERLAAGLGVEITAVRWLRAGRSRSKLLEVDGLSDAEAAQRLRARTDGPR